MDINVTRSILDAIHSGELTKAQYETMDVFNLSVPKTCSGLDPKVLNPVNTWPDKAGFTEEAKKLALKFV
jgi:phosphoenolpyruvate carboxykinase (ATP)